MTTPLTPAEVAALADELSNQPGDGGVAFVPVDLLDRTCAALLALQADADAYRKALEQVASVRVDGRGLDYYWDGRAIAKAALAASEKETK
jgi:ethanolamine utilization microcompartment shell protein EutS